jgi:hypothetical protein
MPGQPPGQTAPPAPVPHVVLPAGWPQPKVDLAAAKLDVPYQLKLRILPPCPAGNDEFEPDDTAGEAKPFEVGQEALLRICKGDQDWLQVTQKAGQDLQVSARYDLSHGTLALDVYDEAGTTVIAKGERQGPDSKPVTGDDTPEARKGRTAVTAVKIPKSKAERVVKLRMSADKDVENFYVLRVEEPPPPSDEGKKDQQEQDDKDKEQDKKDQDKQDKDKKDKPEDKKPDEEEKQRLKQQMQRNDHDPHNLEALEAQRKSQFRNEVPAKDW